MYRALAADKPAAQQASLAGALNNLGAALAAWPVSGGAGSRQEAVTLYRALAADNPAAYQPDLARR